MRFPSRSSRRNSHSAKVWNLIPQVQVQKVMPSSVTGVWGFCDYCGFEVGMEKRWNTRSTLACHIGRDHDWRMGLARNRELRRIQAAKPVAQLVTCDICEVQQKKKSLFTHTARKHFTNSPVSQMHLRKLRQSSVAMKCDVCAMEMHGCSARGNLQSHWISRHTSSRPTLSAAFCDECGNRLVNRSALAKHLLVAHNFSTLWKADIPCRSGCGKTFALKQIEIQHHARQHMTTAQLFCDSCTREFKRRPGLLYHLRRCPLLFR